MVSINELNGMNVVADDAFTIGEVVGAEVNTQNWHITHLQVKLSNEAAERFEYKKPIVGRVTALLPISVVKAVGDIISLDKSTIEIKGIIRLKKD